MNARRVRLADDVDNHVVRRGRLRTVASGPVEDLRGPEPTQPFPTLGRGRRHRNGARAGARRELDGRDPVLPATPRTSTDSPGAKCACSRVKYATGAALPRVTASTDDRRADSATTSSTRATACSTYPPPLPVNARTRGPSHAGRRRCRPP